jgi:hypothetical protein
MLGFSAINNEISTFVFVFVMIPFYSWMRTLLFFERIRELYLSRTRKKLLPLGTESTENLQFGNHKHCSMKTLRIREENPAAWYSNDARQPVITPNAF